VTGSLTDPGPGELRGASFGQLHEPTVVDRFGVWLSGRQIRRWVPSLSGLEIADLGCGYHAAFTRTVLEEVASATLVDVALADDLKSHPRVRAREGDLQEVLASLPNAGFDLVMMVSVLEHLWEPLEAARVCSTCRLGAAGAIWSSRPSNWACPRLPRWTTTRRTTTCEIFGPCLCARGFCPVKSSASRTSLG